MRSFHSALLFVLVACQPRPADRALDNSRANEPAGHSATSTPTTAAPTAAAAVSPPISDTNATLAPLTSDAARGETGARAQLLAWARALELRQFDQAWDLMGNAAKAHTTKAAFIAAFSPLRDITVAVPSGTMEGAAGSLYYTAPATITGVQADGREARQTGQVILRRANDVDGATPAQRAWHIERVDLSPN